MIFLSIIFIQETESIFAVSFTCQELGRVWDTALIIGKQVSPSQFDGCWQKKTTQVRNRKLSYLWSQRWSDHQHLYWFLEMQFLWGCKRQIRWRRYLQWVAWQGVNPKVKEPKYFIMGNKNAWTLLGRERLAYSLLQQALWHICFLSLFKTLIDWFLVCCLYTAKLNSN